MIPPSHVARVWGPRISITSRDKRRVRALLADVLGQAARAGGTLLSMDDTLSRIRKRLPIERSCNPDPELILEQKEFFSSAIDFNEESKHPYLSLPRLRKIETEVSNTIKDLVSSRPASSSGINWKVRLQRELGEAGTTHLDAEVETSAQEEKAFALETLYTQRFSILTGRAGTGKTTVAKILLEGITDKEGRTDILLLAPTGKARVRLQRIAGREAQTIHQFLCRHEWIRGDTLTLKDSGGKRVDVSTIVVDEASMIPLDLLGTLLRAIRFNGVKRLILIGDPNQLPPIGPGRPFVDILNWLNEDNIRRKHIAYLRERARQRNRTSDALRLSDGYVSDFPNPNDDEILSDIARGHERGDLEVHFWNSVPELYQILENRMVKLLSLDRSDKSYLSFNRSLGINDDEEDNSPESWQILSPVRMQRFGTGELNRIIQRKYRSSLIAASRRNRKIARPFGDEDLVWTDKVIQIVNSPRNAWEGKSWPAADLSSFYGHCLRHDENQFVSFDRACNGKPYPRVPTRRFDHDLILCQNSISFRVFDHVLCDSIFDRPTGIKHLKLQVHLRPAVEYWSPERALNFQIS